MLDDTRRLPCRILIALAVLTCGAAHAAAPPRDDPGQRRAAERQRDQARLRAEDARRRAAARARVEELALDLERKQARRAERQRAPSRNVAPPLLTLRRNTRAELGLDDLPAPRAFRVYDGTSARRHEPARRDRVRVAGSYVTTIDRSRFTQPLGGLPVTIDPLRPYEGIVDVHLSTSCFRPPSGVWRVLP